MARGAVTPSRRKLTFIVLGAVVGVAAVVTIVLLARRDSGSGSGSATAPHAARRLRRDPRDASRTPTGTLAWCMLLAETEAQHNRGLMQVTDPTLGGYDGMLFRFDADTNDQFYMRNTPMPLSIAFIASNGDVVSTTDMAPCDDRRRLSALQRGSAVPHRDRSPAGPSRTPRHRARCQGDRRRAPLLIVGRARRLQDLPTVASASVMIVIGGSDGSRGAAPVTARSLTSTSAASARSAPTVHFSLGRAENGS